jgi:hypothetical protein
VTGFLGNLPQADVIRTIELFAKEARPCLQAMPAQAEPGLAVAG